MIASLCATVNNSPLKDKIMPRRLGSWFERQLIGSLRLFNTLLHVVLALALAVASIMVIMEFANQVLVAASGGSLIHDFLNALGILFLLWTLSSLIAAEINYVQGGKIQLAVFLEVAMITLLRSLITEPIQLIAGRNEPSAQPSFDVVHYGALLAAILVVGVIYYLIKVWENGQSHRPAGSHSLFALPKRAGHARVVGRYW